MENILNKSALHIFDSNNQYYEGKKNKVKNILCECIHLYILV